MPAVQQAREHRTNAKTRRDGLYSMGFSWFDCEPLCDLGLLRRPRIRRRHDSLEQQILTVRPMILSQESQVRAVIQKLAGKPCQRVIETSEYEKPPVPPSKC